MNRKLLKIGAEWIGLEDQQCGSFGKEESGLGSDLEEVAEEAEEEEEEEIVKRHEEGSGAVPQLHRRLSLLNSPKSPDTHTIKERRLKN